MAGDLPDKLRPDLGHSVGNGVDEVIVLAPLEYRGLQQ